MSCDDLFFDGELIFIGHSNALTLIPLTNSLTGARMDLSGVTKVDVCVGSVEASSSTLPAVIEWEQRQVDGEDTWVIDIQPGLISGLTATTTTLRVIVFDGDNPDGLVVMHDLPVKVIADC